MSRLSNYSGRANVLVRIGNMEFNVTAEFSVVPGEPAVMYYPDGSGYPGSDPFIDYIESVEVNECEYMTGDIDSDDNWAYTDFADKPGAKEIAERWCREELASGSYDDELFDCADFPEDDYYED